MAPDPPPAPDAGFTRLCVKNVPKHVDERRLKEHFGQRGMVTDAKLLRTKSGESRKIAFVGYRTEAEARAARAFFNQTFLDTSRLVVEAAMPRGASTLTRPWSKYSEGSSRFDNDGSSGSSKRQMDGEQQDGEEDAGDDATAAAAKAKKQRRVSKDEFLATMMPRSQTKFWGNDEVGVVPEVPVKMTKQQQQQQQQQGQQRIKAKKGEGGEKGSSTRNAAGGEGHESEEEESDEEEVKEEEEEEEEEVSAPPATPATGLSDLDYLRSKVKKGLEQEVEGGNSNSSSSSNGLKPTEKKDEEAEDESDDEESSEEEEEEDEVEGDEDDAAASPSPMEQDGNDDADNSKPPSHPRERELPNIEETGRLFLRNFPFSTTEEDLLELLTPHGAVAEVHLPLDDTKRPKGFAFASFLLPEDAARALAALDGQAFQGRLLHVLPAKDPPKDPLAELDPSQARTYKEKKEIERRQKAGDERGWNASYLRSETVVEAVADRLQLEKGQVLDREGGGMAVKLALGETFLLAENREFFKKEGVDLTVLESAAAQQARRKQLQAAKGGAGAAVAAAVLRSKTTLLVKNLPYSTTQEELTQLFGRFGQLGKVVLPPSRALALVDFLEAADAKRAFKGLAYKRFQHVPLYLEWAPMHTFVRGSSGGRSSSSSSSSDKAAAGATTTKAVVAASASVVVAQPQKVIKEVAAVVVEEEEGVEEEGPEGSFTLFVKNLNFATTEEKLLVYFESKTQGVRTVAIPKKTAPVSAAGKEKDKSSSSNSGVLSMGYGFVEYSSVAQAKAALKAMEGTLLEGHRLQCKLSDKHLTARPFSAANNNKQKRTKLVVRNVAFQATPKELKELFGSFGKVKTVRLPKKFDGSHRGFAFVEFLTAQEAGNAFVALGSTHLYGKRLVLEWAEDKEDIETLREKASKDARKGAASALSNEGGGGGGKKKGGSAFDEGFD